MWRARSCLRARILHDAFCTGIETSEIQSRCCHQASTSSTWVPRRKPSLSSQLRQSFKLDEAKPPDGRKVCAGVILERYPICFQDVAPYKVEHEEWSLAWNAWKYRQVPQETLNADKHNVDETSDEAKFKPEPIITEADHANDIRSLRRNTQGYLYLACKGPDDELWQLPQTEVQVSETIRAAAQRCINEMVGSSIETFLFGNMPAAHVETQDARVFYMLGVVLEGDVKLTGTSHFSDYAWLQKPELAQSFASGTHMAKLIETLTVDPQHT